MHKGLIALILVSMTAVLATATQAQEGAERDPFYPSSGRPSAATPRPDGDTENNRADWGRDPFNNPLASTVNQHKGPATPGVRMLTGIIYGKRVRLAIYGGETYRKGSTVGDRKLVDIRRQSVVFRSATGEKEEVFLEDFSVSKRVY
jgi:hypothetical protein